MRSISLLGIAALLSVVAAGKAHTRSICVTSRSTRSMNGPVPTTTKYLTVTYEDKCYVTTTPATTFTPRPTTITSTITTDTTVGSNVPQSTNTFTDTITNTVTSITTLPTVTSTSTSTVPSTTTVPAAGTSTVSAAAGFQPVQSTLPNSAAKKRALLDGKSAAAGSLLARGARKQLCPPIGSKPHQYPVSVTCYGVVEVHVHKVVTKTAHTTTTITAAKPTSTASTTTTLTVTTPMTTPDASTTVTSTTIQTDTATSSPTTTTTTTSTQTVTVPSYTATAYAQCSASNFAGTVNNVGIDTVYAYTSQVGQTTSTADGSQQGCCNSCAGNPLCTGFAFYGGGAQCFNFVASQGTDTCSFGDYHYGARYNSAFGPDGGYIVGNGGCGVLDQISSANS